MRLNEITTPPKVDVDKLSDLLKGNQSRAAVRKAVQYVTNAIVTMVSNKNIERNSIGVNAYYDPDDGTIEITLVFNPSDTIIQWSKENRGPFVHELHDALKHELLHSKQHSKRDVKHYAKGEYLSNPDEIEAYAMNIADQLVRKVGKEETLNLLRKARQSAHLKDKMGNLLNII